MTTPAAVRKLCVGIARLLLAASVPTLAQSNIVVNGSFEQGIAGWELANLVTFAPPFGSVDGTNQLQHWNGTSAPFAAQDLTTVPGRTYVITFAGDMRIVRWGTNVLTLSDGEMVGSLWRYHSATGFADSAVSRLSFEEGQKLDHVQVVWRDEPITIVSPPGSGTGLEGGTATFAVHARGGAPLLYQWLFNGSTIANETNATLTLTGLRGVQAGSYAVCISNVAGAVTSTAAILNIEPRATAPVLLVQPESQTVPAGYAWSFRSLAAGEAPFSYQWFLGSQLVAGATNRTLTFSNVYAPIAGTYYVQVSNALGTTRSIPATLTVATSTTGGWLMASNNSTIRDIDGVTALQGTRYLAQVYAGPTPDLLLPIRTPVAFRSNTFAGFFQAPKITVPNVPAGQTAYAQIRAWDSAWGVTYEEARASGGSFGYSEIRAFTTGTTPNVFHLIPGFSLRAGLPFFYTGRLAHGPTLPGGVRQLVLTGSRGFRYLVEEQVPPNSWQGLFVVTNTTGTVTFTLPQVSPSAPHLYRARILD